MAQAPPSEPIGTRDIDSTPPARIRSAGTDLLGGLVDGLQAGGAEAVESHPGHRVREAGDQCRRTRDDHALIADGRDTAEDDVVDRGGVEIGVAATEFTDQPDDQRDRFHLVQRTAGLAVIAGFAATARGPDRVVDEGVHQRSVLALRISNKPRPL
jgi:hypothetical protein